MSSKFPNGFFSTFHLYHLFCSVLEIPHEGGLGFLFNIGLVNVHIEDAVVLKHDVVVVAVVVASCTLD